MKVGDYVRTKHGYIDKIIDLKPITKYTKYNTLYFEKSIGEHLYSDGELKEFKSSPNIIDLIEYGDIVKYKIDDEEFISEVWGEKNNYFVQNFDVPIDLRDLNIVSIVTKEQFLQMEYKVGE